MTTAAKKREGMRSNPRDDWRIEDLYVVARHWGMEVRNQRGSHHVFSHPDVDFEVTVPANRPIKPVYIRQFVGLVDKLDDQAADKVR
jgi:predicted RNA binding protein YcfA (HicA-like mRNA interferase family)